MLSNILIGIGIALVPTIIGIALPRKKTYGCMRKIGILFSKTLRAKWGRRIENILEKTFRDSADGLWDGLRDDNEIREMKWEGAPRGEIAEVKIKQKELVKVKSRDLI